MTAKQYLKQSFKLNLRIDSDIAEVDKLRALATNIPSANTPKDGTATSKTNDRVGLLIAKIVDLENEIADEIDSLVDLKKEIRQRIMQIENDDYRLILQKRYLNFDKWEQIAVDMDFSMRNIYILHRKALKKFALFFTIDL